MLPKDELVDTVVAFIVAKGWTMQSTAHANELGDDIGGLKDGQRLLVDAKGAGSSKATTKRYGQLFTGDQVGSHIGVALVRALSWVSSGIDYPSMAFPENRHHRDPVDAIAPALAQLRMGIFWVRTTTR